MVICWQMIDKDIIKRKINTMVQQNYQELLSQVQMPTRYIGSEVNSIKKKWHTKADIPVDVTFALVFPDLYEIGTSHFGMQILYTVLNNQNHIAAERFFAPAPDMEMLLLEKNIPCLSLESRRELTQFDIIGISLLYELNFTNILTLFKLSKIPFYARDREEAFPVIIGGGPCAFNPEPLADFFDAFVIGDGEEAALAVANTVRTFKKEGDNRKKTLLNMLSEIDGVYVPSFYEPVYDTSGIQTLQPIDGHPSTVKRAFLKTLDKDTFPVSPIVPFAKPVHDRLRLEIARGCTRGCRFCQAGMIYRPVRERSLNDLIDITREALKTTGYSEISLLSLSTGDYSSLSSLMTQLMALETGHCNAVSLPSIRAEKLTPELMELIKKVRKTGFTIAPEAGSQRLRDIINKNLTRQNIESAVENALNLGWKNIKLYFMTGLPFETDADVQAICDLSLDFANKYAKGKKSIHVSVAGFIPKAHTPFQRCAQSSLEQTQNKLDYLKQHLRHKKVKLKWQNPKMSLLEGVFARGDRQLSRLLITAFENGCRLDGWSDRFNFSLWEDAFEQTGIDPLFYTTRPRSDTEPLPWDVIDSGVSADYFQKEFQKATERAQTLDCRDSKCTLCGVCDFKTIAPVLHSPEPGSSPEAEEIDLPPVLASLPDEHFQKYELLFSKLDDARFFGHLELADIFKRAVKRTGFTVKYSKGFHPSMRLSFENALPVGMESDTERAFIYLERGLSCTTIVQALNETLPRGLCIKKCRVFRKGTTPDNTHSIYTVRFQTPCLEKEAVEQFLNTASFIVQDVSKKGKTRRTDLRKAVEKISFSDAQTLEIELKKYNGREIRPGWILKECFGLDEIVVNTARIRKT